MAVYQPTTATSTSAGAFTATTLPEEAINPITGGMGVRTLKYDLVGGTTPATVEYVATSKVYTFDNVQYTTTSVAGLDAVINVGATVNEYVVTIVSGGTNYSVTDTLTVDGAFLGGISSINDLVITVEASNEDSGAITGISYTGTQVWPQSYTASVYVTPGSGTQFIQVNPISPADGVYLNITNADGDSYIQAVTIVG